MFSTCSGTWARRIWSVPCLKHVCRTKKKWDLICSRLATYILLHLPGRRPICAVDMVAGGSNDKEVGGSHCSCSSLDLVLIFQRSCWNFLFVDCGCHLWISMVWSPSRLCLFVGFLVNPPNVTVLNAFPNLQQVFPYLYFLFLTVLLRSSCSCRVCPNWSQVSVSRLQRIISRFSQLIPGSWSWCSIRRLEPLTPGHVSSLAPCASSVFLYYFSCIFLRWVWYEWNMNFPDLVLHGRNDN